jgi:hypothetical protein
MPVLMIALVKVAIWTVGILVALTLVTRVGVER